MKGSKLKRDWHHAHRMPINATMEQRLEWHLEHAKFCGCRPIPVTVTEVMKKKDITLHNQEDAPDRKAVR